MTLEEYVEAYGYKVADLTESEIKEVKREMAMKEQGFDILDGFFSPMSPFTQRMLQK